jgi:hypothetical protein
VALSYRLDPAGYNALDPELQSHYQKVDDDGGFELPTSTSSSRARTWCSIPTTRCALSVSRAVAIETSRGWRIAKEKASHKIDVIVALAQAALGAVKQLGMSHNFTMRSFSGALIYDSGAPKFVDRTPVD